MNTKIRDMILSSFEVTEPPEYLLRPSVEEDRDLIEPFLGKRWNELDLENTVTECLDVMTSYFLPRALQYYLPGLLVACLNENVRDNKQGLLFSVSLPMILTIQLPLHPDDYHYSVKNYLINLNSLQKKAIASWIKEMGASNEFLEREMDAMNAYWEQYL